MVVSQLWRYPVKSMIGEPVGEVGLDELGIRGDRTWAARDLRRGGIRGAKKIGGLMRLAARDVGEGEVEIGLPDGSWVRTDEPDVNDRVSEALDHPVRLERLRPADDLDHYRRGAPDHVDVMAELNAIFGREAGEPLPDFGVFPPVIMEYESPPGTYYDAYPLMVMSEQVLAGLAAALPDSVVDVRRFRPSMVVDMDATSEHPELELVGRSARVGGATIEFVAPCPRCVMVTREIDASVPADRSILRHVVRQLGQDLGVYARVTAPGRVRVGDAVHVQ